MSSSVPLWQFGTSVEHQRTERLLHFASFDDVVWLLHDATITHFVWESFTDKRLKGCNRATFLLRVSPNAYDAFFNSPVGYRAQYAMGTSTGEQANRQILSSLEQRLLAFALADGQQYKLLILGSLRASQAKIWIYEQEVEDQLGEQKAAILYQPWLKSSLDGAGLLAPIGQQLEVKGGWVNPQGNECVDPAKATRSQDIHDVGFS